MCAKPLVATLNNPILTATVRAGLQRITANRAAGCAAPSAHNRELRDRISDRREDGGGRLQHSVQSSTVSQSASTHPEGCCHRGGGGGVARTHSTSGKAFQKRLIEYDTGESKIFHSLQTKTK